MGRRRAPGMGDEPWTRIGRCASGSIPTRPRPRWRWPSRSGEVRFQGETADRPEAVRQLLERLAGKHGRLRVCYEAGPCGYGPYRQIAALGHDRTAVAP